MIKLGILERKLEDATHLFQLFVKEKAAESTYSWCWYNPKFSPILEKTLYHKT